MDGDRKGGLKWGADEGEGGGLVEMSSERCGGTKGWVVGESSFSVVVSESFEGTLRLRSGKQTAGLMMRRGANGFTGSMGGSSDFGVRSESSSSTGFGVGVEEVTICGSGNWTTLGSSLGGSTLGNASGLAPLAALLGARFTAAFKRGLRIAILDVGLAMMNLITERCQMLIAKHN